MQYFHSCNPQSLLRLESHFSVGIYHDFGEKKKDRSLSAQVDDSIQCHNLYLPAREEGPAPGPCPPPESSPRYGQAVQLVEGDGTLDQALVSPILKDLPRCTF